MKEIEHRDMRRAREAVARELARMIRPSDIENLTEAILKLDAAKNEFREVLHATVENLNR